MKKYTISLRAIILTTSILGILVWWINSEVSKGRRDAEHLNFFLEDVESPLMNAQFESDYVILPTWLGKRAGLLGDPFERVVGIDFRLDNLVVAKDIAPYTVFRDVRVIRIDSLPVNEEAFLELSKFESLNTIYVSRFESAELEAASKKMKRIEILPGS